MDEDQAKLTRAYKRGGIGLAAAAVLWTAAFVIAGHPEDDKMNWLIPIGAAALSLLCFSRYAKSKEL